MKVLCMGCGDVSDFEWVVSRYGISTYQCPVCGFTLYIKEETTDA